MSDRAHNGTHDHRRWVSEQKDQEGQEGEVNGGDGGIPEEGMEDDRRPIGSPLSAEENQQVRCDQQAVSATLCNNSHSSSSSREPTGVLNWI